MASIKYTAFVNEIKGKIAGTVFQGGYGGSVVKTKPSNTRKIFLSAMVNFGRSSIINAPKVIAELATQWRALTDPQRLSWSSMAPEYPFKNRFGETYIGSGFQVYMHLNSKLLNVGNEKMLSAPIPAVLPATPDYHFTVLGFPALELVLDGPFPAGCKLVLSATSPISPTANTIYNKLKAIKIINSLDVFPLDVTDDYVQMKGTIPAGAFINWKLEAVNLSTGQTSTPKFFTTQL